MGAACEAWAGQQDAVVHKIEAYKQGMAHAGSSGRLFGLSRT